MNQKVKNKKNYNNNSSNSLGFGQWPQTKIQSPDVVQFSLVINRETQIVHSSDPDIVVPAQRRSMPR